MMYNEIDFVFFKKNCNFYTIHPSGELTLTFINSEILLFHIEEKECLLSVFKIRRILVYYQTVDMSRSVTKLVI